MAQNSWPSPGYNNRGVTDIEHEKLAARFSDDGVYGSPLDAAVVSAGAGLAVNIRAGVEASVRGHGWTSGASTVSLPIGANTVLSARVDRVVLRLDRSSWTVRAVVKEGVVPGSAPALAQQTGDTGIYEIPLARVTILKNAAAVSVAREELYVGARIRTCTSSTRNPNPVRGEMCYETDTGIVRVWTGSAWKVVYEDGGTVGLNTPISVWEPAVESVLEKRNGVVHLRFGSIERVGGTLAANTESRLPIQIPARYQHPTRAHYGLAYITGASLARFQIYAANSDRSGQVWLVNHPQINTGNYILPQSGPSWVVD